MNSHEFGFPPFYIDSYHPLCLPSVSDSGRLAYFSFVCLFSLSIKGSCMLPCKKKKNIEELPTFSLRTQSSFISLSFLSSFAALANSDYILSEFCCISSFLVASRSTSSHHTAFHHKLSNTIVSTSYHRITSPPFT